MSLGDDNFCQNTITFYFYSRVLSSDDGGWGRGGGLVSYILQVSGVKVMIATTNMYHKFGLTRKCKPHNTRDIGNLAM